MVVGKNIPIRDISLSEYMNNVIGVFFSLCLTYKMHHKLDFMKHKCNIDENIVRVLLVQ